MRATVQDLCRGWRLLRRSRGFAALAIIMLAVGIGASAAIFSIINAIALRPLPIRDPGGLILLGWKAEQPPHPRAYSFYSTCPASGAGDLSGCSFTESLFHALRPAFGRLAAYSPGAPLAVTRSGTTELADVEYVTGNFFDVVGVRPAFGRLFAPADNRPGAPVAAVASYGYFVSRLGGDRRLIGTAIAINHTASAVLIGVTARGFTGLSPGFDQQLWLPMTAKSRIEPQSANSDRDMGLQLLARSPRVAEAQTRFARAATAGPQPLFSSAARPRLSFFPGGSGLASLRKLFSDALRVLMIAAGLLLLTACLNVAGLLLARGATRRREMAVRQALGASGGRIVRQLLAEGLGLAAAATVVGIALGYAGARGLVEFFSRNWFEPIMLSVAPDWRVLVFAGSLAAVTVALFGLAPAVGAARVAPVTALKQGGASERRSGAGAVVVAEVALAMFVLAGAGLLVRTLASLRHQAIGFDAHNLLLFSLDPSMGGYTNDRARDLDLDLQRGLSALPGVVAASSSSTALLSGSYTAGDFYVGARQAEANMLNVGPGFFATMRLPLLAGRDFTLADLRPHAPAVAVVNRAFVRRYLGNQNPLGLRVRAGSQTAAPTVIVGMAGDAKYDSLRKADSPTVYLPLTPSFLTFEVRTAKDPLALVPAVRGLVRRVAPGVPIFEIKTQQQQISQLLWQERLLAGLSSLFAVFALLLACGGLYAMLAYDVSRRTREIGIRMALGARAGDLERQIAGRGARLALIGAAAGIAAALFATRALTHILYGVKANDASTYAAAAAAVAAVAWLACWLPARSATRVDPQAALRQE
ncbi:MAG TPA: ADOP family duplicated permease [Terriglobales bacterium]|nr:ADOP family duplicated permease [Terriglobales bacterium]